MMSCQYYPTCKSLGEKGSKNVSLSGCSLGGERAPFPAIHWAGDIKEKASNKEKDKKYCSSGHLQYATPSQSHSALPLFRHIPCGIMIYGISETDSKKKKKKHKTTILHSAQCFCVPLWYYRLFTFDVQRVTMCNAKNATFYSSQWTEYFPKWDVAKYTIIT